MYSQLCTVSRVQSTVPTSHKIQSVYPSLYDKLLLSMPGKPAEIDYNRDSFVGLMDFCYHSFCVHQSGLGHYVNFT